MAGLLRGGGQGWPMSEAGLTRWGFCQAGDAVAANPALGREEPDGSEMGLMVAKSEKPAPHGCPVF